MALYALCFHRSFGYSLLASFAAGAALSATSLGTTFAVLRADTHDKGEKSLLQTRIAVVLLSAAIIDDVVALIMASVIESIKGGNETHRSLGWTIGRPILASLAMSFLILFVGLLLTRLPPRLKEYMQKVWSKSIIRRYRRRLEFVILFLTLTATSVGAAYAGTSILYGAFLAGLLLSSITPTHIPQPLSDPSDPSAEPSIDIHHAFNTYLFPVLSQLLSPLFFASIGFSIPLRQMFTTRILWRGFVYALMMLIAKAAVGFWVVLWNYITSHRRIESNPSGSPAEDLKVTSPDFEQRTGNDVGTELEAPVIINTTAKGEEEDVRTSEAKGVGVWFLPASFLGSGMVARGEIGLLIAQIAYGDGQGILPTDLFLISLWALVLNTIIGPISVSIVLSRWGVTLMKTPWGTCVYR
ncbi:Hsp70 ATPase ssc1 [Serendipita sp. 399]|nr:Hsp70 ATPase ssc1 [Serendipita sp. 399]